MELNKVIKGDCIEIMKEMPENSIDTIITDPPYGIGFMGKEWDTFKEEHFKDKRYYNKLDEPTETGVKHRKFGSPAQNAGGYNQSSTGHKAFAKWTEVWAREALRVTKPGGTILCFSGTRTQHSVTTGIEDAGWVIKDCIMYLYGSGFPKSLNIEKSLQKKYDCGNMEEYEKSTEQKTKYNLRLMPEADLQKTINSKDKQGEVLQSELSEQNLQIQQLKSTVNVWERQSSVERGNNIKTSKRELQRCKVCQMSERVVENGKERWICYGTPFGYGTETWKDTPENRSCPSYRPQSEQQRPKQSNVVSDKPSSQKIRRWHGYGTSLKPAYEPIIVAVKPNEGTYANNALKYGVAGLNIDGGRIENKDRDSYGRDKELPHTNTTSSLGRFNKVTPYDHTKGRFPSNLILDSEAAKMLDEQSGERPTGGVGRGKDSNGKFYGGGFHSPENYNGGDKGGASRFFYTAKASKAERNMGCEGLPVKQTTGGGGGIGDYKNDVNSMSGKYGSEKAPAKNNHPTVKPLKLMEYLCTLTKTPTGGIVLDPFTGSGTTCMAAKATGRPFIGIEKEEEYVKIAEARIKAVQVPLL